MDLVWPGWPGLAGTMEKEREREREDGEIEKEREGEKARERDRKTKGGSCRERPGGDGETKGAPGSGPGIPGKRGRELPDRVRERSRTLSGPSRQEGLAELFRALPTRENNLLLAAGGIS